MPCSLNHITSECINSSVEMKWWIDGGLKVRDRGMYEGPRKRGWVKGQMEMVSWWEAWRTIYRTVAISRWWNDSWVHSLSVAPLMRKRTEKRFGRGRMWDKGQKCSVRLNRLLLFTMFLKILGFSLTVMEKLQQEPSKTGLCVQISLCFVPPLWVDCYSSLANTVSSCYGSCSLRGWMKLRF